MTSDNFLTTSTTIYNPGSRREGPTTEPYTNWLISHIIINPFVNIIRLWLIFPSSIIIPSQLPPNLSSLSALNADLETRLQDITAIDVDQVGPDDHYCDNHHDHHDHTDDDQVEPYDHYYDDHHDPHDHHKHHDDDQMGPDDHQDDSMSCAHEMLVARL